MIHNISGEKVDAIAIGENDCVTRITNYLLIGGLFNPELMEHEKVSKLLQDSRDRIKYLEERVKFLAEKASENFELAVECDENLVCTRCGALKTDGMFKNR